MKLPVKYRGKIYEVEVDEEDGKRILNVLNSPRPQTNRLGRNDGWLKRQRGISYVPAWKNRGFRPALWVGGKLVYLARWILGVTDSSKVVDHIDQNPLNNTRENLRVVGKSENALNSVKKRDTKASSKYRGVCWHAQTKSWLAYANLEGIRFSLGLWSTEELAALARDMFVRENGYGMATLNFPDTVGGK